MQPPREIPWLTRLTVLFSGFYMQFGWIFFSFGMIFFWIFVMNSEIVYALSRRDWQPAQAVVLESEPTGASVNGRTVYRHRYRYEAEGRRYEGEGFLTGQSLEPGRMLPVQYDRRQPEESRPEAGGRALFGYEVAFVMVFPLVGLIFILIAFRQNTKALDLLVNGKFARGTLVRKEPTNTSINKQIVWRFTFSFTADDGQTYEATGSTHETWLLEDERTERLLYAPSDPSYAAMYDTIAGAPPLSRDGELQPLPLSKTLALVLPGVSILIHGWVYLTFFA
ncbi:MAG: DUF3592 domain-containing protein [Bacteroidia bacterium]|nr:DUF3592 domain-containing protein [Bacteroidia bacterium]